MELHLHSHRWVARQPDWAAAAVAGFGAGGILMVLELAWTAFAAQGDPWLATRMIAAMVMGWDVLQTTGYSLGVVIAALAVHYILGVAFGIMLAAIIAPFQLDSSTPMVLFTGAVFGLVLYVLNFYGMVGAFSWFAELRGWPTAIGHAIFGMSSAYIYRKMENP
ncbi:hypothetical protein GCM10027277_37280 [Pseudoduganella ginsengisoli]|uniref:Sodium:proline symporter n=1 Tax=Pseudoduganella ginsengisoli TaxID=1462440 RepID=A0A6L6PZB8_9BURK|nr:hypothetical protein [Pseudoduganella ginsengisoli]MTW02348.1 hypothetical protein [Pseudoduganella ginsengisoli]